METRILRGEPAAGLEASGPAIFELPEATLVLPPGWHARVDEAGTIQAHLDRRRKTGHEPAGGEQRSTPRSGAGGASDPDPIQLQVLIGGLRAACEEMGAVLIRSAYSANIKERHDCSTALFDAAGELVMQAEHIPVHLGSMPEAVAAVLGDEQRPGVDWILNDPYRGGTHLPDITLISPGLRSASALLGFAASRAHHADVGGPTPGGMPAFSRRLADEGVVIPPTRADDETLARARLADAQPAPAPRRPARPAGRQPGRRAARVAELAGRHRRRAPCARGWRRSSPTPSAAPAPRSPRFPTASTRAEDVLEDDAGGGSAPRRPPAVEATIAGDRSRLDFAGTDPQVEGNLNCPLSVTRSAAFFAVRVLTDPDAPPSAGAHRPIEVDVPDGLPAQRPLPRRRRRRQRRDLEPRRRPRDRGARRAPGRSRPRARGR